MRDIFLIFLCAELYEIGTDPKFKFNKKETAITAKKENTLKMKNTCTNESAGNASSKELLNLLNKKIEAAEARLSELLNEKEPKKLREICGRNSYISKELEQGKYPDYGNYDDDCLYFHRYIRAYAFEYSVIWESVLRDYLNDGGTVLGCTSFGCGSGVEAWSLGYAKAKLMEKYQLSGAFERMDKLAGLKLYYTGVDQIKWPLSFIDLEDPENRVLTDMFENMRGRTKGNFMQADIVDFIDNNSIQYKNVLMFPKILNELTSDNKEKNMKCWEEVLDLLKQKKIDKRDKYYLVISHSKDDACHEDKRIGIKFSETFKKDMEKKFLPNDRIFENVTNSCKNEVARDDETGVYHFEKTYTTKNGKAIGQCIKYYDSDFSDTEVSSGLCDKMCSSIPEYKNYIKRTDHIYFQIISFTKKSASRA